VGGDDLIHHQDRKNAFFALKEESLEYFREMREKTN
jgi:hypothetical protein